MIDRALAAEVATAAADQAAGVVMRIYATAFGVEYKAKDDPVTSADREANALICELLARRFPSVPVVAEESDPASYAGFAAADAVWFVDPLDGTREFVAKNGEFAVMIGLAERGVATVGVIVAPAWGRSFVGVVGQGAFEVRPDGARTPVHVSRCGLLAEASFVLSRSRTSPALAETVAAMAPRASSRHGSSGLKGALVAVGDRDVYLQTGRAGMRWDACATEALVCAAGGRCTDVDGRPFDYAVDDLQNRRGLVATNGLLHDAVLERIRTLRDA